MDYRPEELLDDREFLNWALRGKNEKEWKSFLLQHPEFNNQVQKAQEIISLLRDSIETLVEEDKLSMWKNIKQFDTLQKKSSRIIVLKRVLRYAAVFLILATTGAFMYWYMGQPVNKYDFLAAGYADTEGEAKLVLSTGEEVRLKKDNSSIVVSGDQKIIIDDEQAIDVRSHQITSEAVKMNEVIIPFGKKSQIVLDDGTKVWLNAGSRLAFPTRFTGKTREVYLQGEAYFEVIPYSGQLFIVNTADISAKVLGTRFNISAYRNDSEIITVLLEGSVSLSDNTSRGLIRKETVLEPGQKASYARDTRAVNVKNEEDVEFYIAWTEGWFRFYQENLTTVLKKLERYYNVETEFISPYTSTDLISGKLDLKDSLEDVMTVLADVAEIEYQIVEKKVLIRKKSRK